METKIENKAPEIPALYPTTFHRTAGVSNFLNGFLSGSYSLSGRNKNRVARKNLQVSNELRLCSTGDQTHRGSGYLSYLKQGLIIKGFPRLIAGVIGGICEGSDLFGSVLLLYQSKFSSLI